MAIGAKIPPLAIGQVDTLAAAQKGNVGRLLLGRGRAVQLHVVAGHTGQSSFAQGPALGNFVFFVVHQPGDCVALGRGALAVVATQAEGIDGGGGDGLGFVARHFVAGGALGGIPVGIDHLLDRKQRAPGRQPRPSAPVPTQRRQPRPTTQAELTPPSTSFSLSIMEQRQYRTKRHIPTRTPGGAGYFLRAENIRCRVFHFLDVPAFSGGACSACPNVWRRNEPLDTRGKPRR